MGAMDEQSLFDSYDNQKVPSGKPGKLNDSDPWSKKRSIESDFDDFHIPPKRSAPFEEPKPEANESADDKRVIVPADPMCWTNEHVRQWVQWAIKEFSLKDVDISAFTMTGLELCKLTREEFLRLAPAYNGDILMAHLCVLRKGKIQKLHLNSTNYNFKISSQYFVIIFENLLRRKQINTRNYFIYCSLE